MSDEANFVKSDKFKDKWKDILGRAALHNQSFLRYNFTSYISSYNYEFQFSN